MYETKNAKETLQELEVNPETGLSTEEAGQRMAKYGLNKLAEKKKKPLILVFLGNFNDPMIFILIAAALLSLAILASTVTPLEITSMPLYGLSVN